MSYVYSPSYAKRRTINVTPYIIGAVIALTALVTIPATYQNIKDSQALQAKINLNTFNTQSQLQNGMLQNTKYVDDIQGQSQGDCGTTIQGASCGVTALQVQAYQPIQGNYAWHVQDNIGADNGRY